MKLSYPINGPIITQQFGANPQFYSNPIYGGIKGHNGIDFLTYHGQPVYATHNGLAQFQKDGSAGCGIVIFNNEGYKTIYWHLCDSGKEPQYKSPFESSSGEVENGDLIGYADNTGASTGDHLHFGLKFCEKDEPTGTWFTLDHENGYLGAVDPKPFFDGSTPEQIINMRKQIGLLTKIVNLLKLLFKS